MRTTMGFRGLLGFSLIFLVLLSGQVMTTWGQPAESAPSVSSVSFTLNNLMPPDGLFGTPPTDLSWSYDDRFFTFRWEPRNATGTDVWAYDWSSRELLRITSPQLFADHERTARLVASATDPATISAVYPGVDAYDWSPDSHRMMVRYAGDWYRIAVPPQGATRVTRTPDREPGYTYTHQGDGFLYRDGDGYTRMRFDSSYRETVSVSLPAGLRSRGVHLSPGEESLFVVAERPQEAERRTVGYPSFRGRFLELVEHNRPLAEDDFSPPEDVHVFLAPSRPDLDEDNGGQREILTLNREDGGPFRVSEPAWTEDETRVAFCVYALGSNRLSLYVAGCQEGEAEAVYQAESLFPHGSRKSALMEPPLFLPDNSGVVIVLDDTGYYQPWTIDLITRGKIPMVTGRFHALPLGFDDDGSHLFLWANREHPIQKDLYALSLSNGYLSRVTRQVGAYSSLSVSHNGRYYAGIFGNWESPPELVVGDRLGQNERILSDSHPDEWSSLNRIRPELFSYTNRHGQTVHGKVFLPQGWSADDQRPLYVYTYGGPLSVQRGSKVHYDLLNEDNYRFPMYMAAKHGYVSAVIDTRGSSGYNLHFTNANWEQPGIPQGEDLADGVAYLADHYGVDPGRAALGGWSFGGTTTLMTLFTQPGVFTAGIAGAGVTEWENYYGGYSARVIGPSQSDQPDQREWSVLPYAKHLEDHLLLHHGVEDSNVLLQDTMKVYQALLQAGKGTRVRLLLDTTGGHGSGGGFNMNGDLTSAQRYTIYEDYLLEHLGRAE